MIGIICKGMCRGSLLLIRLNSWCITNIIAINLIGYQQNIRKLKIEPPIKLANEFTWYEGLRQSCVFWYKDVKRKYRIINEWPKVDVISFFNHLTPRESSFETTYIFEDAFHSNHAVRLSCRCLNWHLEACLKNS